MKKLIFTNKSDVRLGFEIECLIRGSDDYYGHNYRNVNDFKKAIRDLNKNVQLGYDGSIIGSGTPFEIRTMPLPPKDSIILLKELFDIVNKYGLTNKSCGFHVNISSVHKTKMKNFNPIPFLSSKLWNEILTKFGRTGNGYCRPLLRTSIRSMSKVKALSSFTNAFEEKYSCVNLIHFNNGQDKSSRVEVRGFGNKDYTQKFDMIAKYIGRITKLFKFSCEDRPLCRVPNI